MQVLDFLGQRPPAELAGGDRDALWQWAIAHWNPANIPRLPAICSPY
jgi:hypothetical protein